MNQRNNDLQLEIESLKKTIEDLKIEENIFNGISIEVYNKQREVDNLTWLLMESEKTISEIIKNNKENQEKLEKLLEQLLQRQYDLDVERCIKSEIQTFYPEEYERKYGSDSTINETLSGVEKDK